MYEPNRGWSMLDHKKRVIMSFVSITLIITIAGIVLSGCGSGKSSVRKITVMATGIGEATPNHAKISVSIITDGATVAEATSINNQRTTAVVEALKGLGLDKKLLKTQTISVAPIYDPTGATQNIVGYRATNQIRVTVKKIDELGRVMETAIAAGANQVDSLEMKASTLQEATEKGLEEAVKNAQAKAESAAEAAGQELGSLLSVSEEPGFSPYTDIMYVDQGITNMLSAGQAPVLQGQNEYAVTIKAVFEIK